MWPCSRWGLPCHLRYRRRGGLLPRRFTLTARAIARERSGLFSVALSSAFPPPGVTRHRALWSSDFPPVLANRRSLDRRRPAATYALCARAQPYQNAPHAPASRFPSAHRRSRHRRARAGGLPEPDDLARSGDRPGQGRGRARGDEGGARPGGQERSRRGRAQSGQLVRRRARGHRGACDGGRPRGPIAHRRRSGGLLGALRARSLRRTSRRRPRRYPPPRDPVRRFSRAKRRGRRATASRSQCGAESSAGGRRRRR